MRAPGNEQGEGRAEAGYASVATFPGHFLGPELSHSAWLIILKEETSMWPEPPLPWSVPSLALVGGDWGCLPCTWLWAPLEVRVTGGKRDLFSNVTNRLAFP